MTATKASVSTPPAGLVQAIVARYRLQIDGAPERLEGGYENVSSWSGPARAAT